MPQVGQVLNDRYQLQERLGRDASRQTWLAVDLDAQPQTQVVVKLLALSPEMPWDECKLFEREAQVLQLLDHPRIPQYRDYFVLDHPVDSRFSWFSLVESYMPGKSLQQWLNLGYHFSEAQVKKIAVEVLAILVYLHELEPPVLHRDIKPSNLIWGKGQRVYLVDFGAVQDKAAAEGATFTVVGTYGYVPMEQFGGRAEPASDLYALGATLIHLLTGVAPADLPQQDGRVQFGDRVNFDLGLLNWIGKLTEPNLTDRLSTARQALKALNHKHTLSPPITNRRPTGSQIQLHKSARQLKIEIPRRGFRALDVLYMLGVAGILSYFPLYIIRLAVSRYPGVVFWLYFAVIYLFVSLIWLLLPALQQTHLYFDRKRFEIVWKVFGLCYWRRRGKTAEIDGWRSVYADPEGRKGVTIEAKRRYASSSMSDVERVWLIQEIRDWLDPAFRNFRVKPGIFTDEMLDAGFDEWIYKKEDFD
ncbi:MAG: serine/threonine protein kinase [Pseudanabaenales cyanobacterium]|nr:serine/threonine protein kinase [Pseudanabaenales cyanobacterium]